jgi:oligo-1,6-glucosidase
VSRFGDDSPAHRVASAKLLATWLHMHQGTPYIYQGEELGMTNVRFDDIASHRDIETLNHHRVATTERGEDPANVMAAIHAKSRDNARTPMPWTAGPQAGFTTGTPWLACNPNHTHINAEQALADPGSVFHHYRQLVQMRRHHPVLVHGRYDALLPKHPHVDAFTRTLGTEQWLVVCNFSSNETNVDVRQGLFSFEIFHLHGTHPAAGQLDPACLALRPWEALVCRVGGTAAAQGAHL